LYPNILFSKMLLLCWLDQVEVLAKIYWGDAREKLCEAVDDLKVNSFVLGCRGLGPLKRLTSNLSSVKLQVFSLWLT